MSRVVVVGAGPAGLALAYLLARNGVEVVVLERQRDFERAFRGEVLMPSALEALEQMDLGEMLAAVPQIGIRGAEAYFEGRRFLRVDFDEDNFGGRLPAWVSQPRLLESLVERCARFDGFRLERGATARELLRDGGRVVGVRTADAELAADLVVGADGRASVVRRDLDVSVRRDRAAMDVVWCRVPLPDYVRDDPRLHAYLGRAHFAITGPTPDDALQIGWVIRKGQFGELRARGLAEWMDALCAHVSPRLAEHLRAHRDAVDRPFLLDVIADRVQPWSAPGALLIGDAAHTMSPVGAQGINIAIRDAVVAANALVSALPKGSAAVDAACAAIEAERLPEVRWIQRMQAVPPRIALRDAWWSSWAIRMLPRLAVGRRAGGPFVRRFARGVTHVEPRV